MGPPSGVVEREDERGARCDLTSGHLWQIDVVRLLTFAAVISVHAIAYTEQPANAVAGGAMMLLQFGREVFFALTAFVLVYSAQGRAIRLRRFWPKRLAYVAVPYVCWSAIYYAYSVLGPQHLTFSLATFGLDLADGNAMYHLYFLLVTLQLYLVFPALVVFLRRTAHRAVPVLVAAGALNAAWFAVLHWVPAPGGAGGWVWAHAYELLPSYAIYVLAGGYAALHLPRLQAAVERHGRRLLAASAGLAAAALAVYAVQLPWSAPRVANDVLQPGMLLSCAAAVGLLYWVGGRWAAGPRRHERQVAALSDASFGVYLAHPLVLVLLLDHGFGNGHQVLPAPLATVLAGVTAALGATVIALAARRSPLSLLLAGRPWRDAGRRRRPIWRLAPALPRVSQETSRPRTPAFQPGR